MSAPKGLAGLDSYYGRPYDGKTQLSAAWKSQNIVMMDLPYPMEIAWDRGNWVNKIAVHRKVVGPLTDVLQEIYDTCRRMAKANKEWADEAASKQYQGKVATQYWDKRTNEMLDKYGLRLYGGAFNFRKKRGTKWFGARALSVHSWGAAIDIDPEHNGMGVTRYRMPQFAIQIFEKHGWTAGARWAGKGCDAMHFQYASGV